MKQATLSSVSEPLLEDCRWNNDGSINWVADPFPENIQELIVNYFDDDANENEEYVGQECESEMIIVKPKTQTITELYVINPSTRWVFIC